MKSFWRVADVAIHLLLFVAAVIAMLWITTGVGDLTTRLALLSLVGLLSAVALFGWVPSSLGPVADSVPARIARLAGVVLAGSGAAIVADGLLHPGGSLFVRSASAAPSYAVGFAVYLAALLLATRRNSDLPPRAVLISVGFGLVAAALFAAAVPTLRQQVTHYFDREDEARAMLQRMLDTTPAPFADWAKMTLSTKKR